MSAEYKKNILKIEALQKRASMLKISRDFFERKNFKVTSKEDGENAWTAINENDGNSSFDLIVVEHLMPKLTGLEIIQKLRENNFETPAILFSGIDRRLFEHHMPRVGLQLIMQTPVEVNMLLEIIDATLNIRRNDNE